MTQKQRRSCIALVGSGKYRCSNDGKYEHDGKWYCKSHHKPTQEAAKREKALRASAIEYMRQHHAEIVAEWEEGL